MKQQAVGDVNLGVKYWAVCHAPKLKVGIELLELTHPDPGSICHIFASTLVCGHPHLGNGQPKCVLTQGVEAFSSLMAFCHVQAFALV